MTNKIIVEKDGSLTVNVNAGEFTLVNKDLTDDEIEQIYDSKDWYNDWEMFDYKDFARAILKKASEK
jgi:hypothetical protein